MSGHSKWANIKHRKGKSDAQKGKIFTKIGRELSIAVRQGGPDPESNYKLKDVIAKAKTSNMPNESIMKSIKKAAGDVDNASFEEITYEGYGPGGVAIIVEAMTDNRNRTAGEIRHCFDKYGGNLGTTGCVSFMFNKKGVIMVEKDSKINEEKLMTEVIDAGAEDFNVQDEYYEIVTGSDDYYSVRETLENKGYEFLSARIEMVPIVTTRLTDPKHIELMDKLAEHLEELDDVHNVFHSWEEE